MPEASSSSFPILNNLPNTTGVQQTGTSVESGLGGILSSFGSINPSNPQSPLFAITSSLQEVGQHLNFDSGPLTKLYPDALQVIQNALPPDTLQYVHSIEQAYTTAQDFLQNSALAREIKPGSTLQDVALAAVKDVLQAFDERQLKLHENLINPKLLEQFKSALTVYEGLRTNFAAHAAEFLPFISKHLFGIEPNLLQVPLEHVASALSVIDPLKPSAIEAVLKSAQDALAHAFLEVSNLVDSFDPADAAAYEHIKAQLTALQSATNGLQEALAPLYLQLSTLIDSHAWDDIFPSLTRLLQGVKLDALPSVDDVVHTLVLIIERIQEQLRTFAGPQELVTRMEAMSSELTGLFSNSAVGQVRRVMREFLEQIRHAIETVPTEEVQKAIEGMLNRVKQEVDALGLEQFAQTIEKGFQDAEKFVGDHINETLKNNVRDAVKTLLDNLNVLQDKPLKALSSNITTAIERVQELLNELNQAFTSHVDQIKEVLSKLEELSFKPVGDIVVGEIDDLKKRVKAIKPNALSDPEKLAIKAALAFLDGIHLEQIIADEAKKGFKEATDKVKPLLNDLEAVLGKLRDQLEQYSPERFVSTLLDVLKQGQAVVDKLDAKVLLRPLFEQVDGFAQRLESISPGSLLDPLQQPFDSVVSVVNKLDPVQLIAPLNALYAQIDKLINTVDVTPLLDELDKRQKDLFKTARNSLLSALDKLTLPEPFKEFFDGMRPVLEAMTDAIFQDPDKEMERLSKDLSTRFNITSVFKPLDKVFDELLRAVAAVPANDLLNTFETLRKTLGVALDVLNPRTVTDVFGRGQRQLEELSPRLLFSSPLSLPGLKLKFQTRVATASSSLSVNVDATLLQFDAINHLLNPDDPQSLIGKLTTAHHELTEALSRRLNSFNVAEAETAYNRVREQLVKVLPDFLRRTVQLTSAEITAGLESLRPSRKAAELQRVFDSFLQQVQPLQAELETAGKRFFRAVRDTLELLNPLALKDSVAEIYDTIRKKAHLLDPARLAASLGELFKPVMAALKALDPAALKARLNAAYQKVLKAVVDGVKLILKDIEKALDEQLKQVRDAVTAIFGTLKTTIETATKIFKEMVKKIEDLVFVEILARLRKVLDNLGVSFDKELDRILNAFNQMLAALPLDVGPRREGASASI